MSVKRVEKGAGTDQVVLPVSGAVVVTGQIPLSPVVLAAGEACGAVADGGLSTREGKGREIPGGNQRRRSAAGTFPEPQAPTKEGLDGPERTRTIRQDSSQNRKPLLQPERSEARFST